MTDTNRKHDQGCATTNALDRHIDALESSTAAARKAYLFLLALASYLMTVALSVTHEQILALRPMELPFIQMQLPLLAIFILLPFLVLVLHLNLLLQLKLLARSVFAAMDHINAMDSTCKEENLTRLPSFLFNIMLAGTARSGSVQWMITISVWLTAVVFPFATFLSVYYGFLPHQDWLVWYHLGLTGADSLLLIWLWPNIITRNEGCLSLPRLAAAAAAVALVVAGFTAFALEKNGSLIITGKTLYQQEAAPEVLAAVLQRDPDLTMEQARRLTNTPIDLTNRKLRGAQLYAIDLQGANLTGADLTKADLSEANLTGASLKDATLHGADFSGAILEGAHAPRAQFIGADLSQANLQGAYLPNASFAAADLSESNLIGTNLHSSSLRGADVSHAEVYFTDLRDADLRTADFEEASLFGSRFTNTVLADLTHANLDALDEDHAAYLQESAMLSAGYAARITKSNAGKLALQAEQSLLAGAEEWSTAPPVQAEATPPAELDKNDPQYRDKLDNIWIELITAQACENEFMATGLVRNLLPGSTLPEKPDKLQQALLDTACSPAQKALKHPRFTP